MRVDIRHREETKGMLTKTTYCVVDVRFHFSEEERHIINRWGLNTRILTRGVPADKDPAKFANSDTDAIFSLWLSRVLDGGDSYALASPGEAKAYHEQLREQLPLLKEFIMQNAGIETASESIEL